MKHWPIAVIVLSLVCAAGTYAEEGAAKPDRPPGGRRMEGGGMLPPRLAEELGLTDEQKDKVRKLEEETAVFRKLQHEKLMAILTPEQKEKLEKKRKEMMERMKERRGADKGRPPEAAPEKN